MQVSDCFFCASLALIPGVDPVPFALRESVSRNAKEEDAEKVSFYQRQRRTREDARLAQNAREFQRIARTDFVEGM